MLNVNWIADAAAGQAPSGDAEALAFSLEADRSWSYRELHEQRNRYANGLADLGVRPGDRVGLLMGNSLEYIGTYFAIARLGAVAVRLNFRLTTSELRYAVADSGTSVLCVDHEYLAQIAPIRRDLGLAEVIVFGGGRDAGPEWTRPWDILEESSPQEPSCAQPAAGDLMMLMYTSGTTGSPKAAKWTHATTMGRAAKIALELKFDESTVAMTAGPLYHAGSFESMLLSALLCRGRAICGRSGGFDLRRMVDVMRTERVTDAMLYPFMIHELLCLEGLSRELLPDLKTIMTGGDVVLPSVAAGLRERLPGLELVNGFGLTEGPNVTILRDHEFAAHPGSIGRSWMMSEVAVVGDDGKHVSPARPGKS